METAISPAAEAPPLAPVVTPSSGGYRKVKASEAAQGRPYRLPSGALAELEGVMGAKAYFKSMKGTLESVALDAEVEDMEAPLPAEKPVRKLVIKDVAPEPEPTKEPSAPASPANTVIPPDAPKPGTDAAAKTAADATPAAPTEPKRGRGRPKKTAAPGEPVGLSLFIDCVPNHPYTDLAAWVADLQSALAESGKVPHIQAAPKDHPFAYSGWRGVLGKAAVEKAPDGFCVIHSSDLTQPVIDALVGVADLVVRG